MSGECIIIAGYETDVMKDYYYLIQFLRHAAKDSILDIKVQTIFTMIFIHT